MTRTLTPPAPVSLAAFDAMFEEVKNWGRWGPDDELGTLNYLTPDKVAAAAGLVRSGRTVSMAIPINKAAGPDNPNPAVHLMSLMHDLPVSPSGLSFGMCFLGMASHGDCHTHVDALNHVAYRGQLYNGKPASLLTSKGSEWGSIAAYANGIVGRGVLLDAARYRKVDWLEPGEAVTRARARGDRGGARASGSARATSSSFAPATTRDAWRSAPGATNIRPPARARRGCMSTPFPGCTNGASPPSSPTATARPCRAMSRACPIPSMPLQLTAMGMLISDSLQLEDLAKACEAEGRFEFMVVGLPLRLPGGTGSPWNPIAIF